MPEKNNTNKSTKLILVCGLPGAGKTTLAKQLEGEIPAVRFCPDEWMADLGIDLHDEETRERLEKRFWRLTQDLLKLDQSVILEFGFWGRSERDEKRLGAKALGVQVEIRYLSVPIDELATRIETRNNEENHGVASITREQLDQFAKSFQPPDKEELALFD